MLTRIAICLSLLVAAEVAVAVNYWPMADNLVYHYENAEGRELAVTFVSGSRKSSYSNGGAPYYWTWEGFSVDGDGDLLLVSNSDYSQGAIDPNYMWTFSPPVKFIDLPLEVGKTWVGPTTASGYGSHSTFFFYTVAAEETVTVPFGTFTAMVLVETCIVVGDHSGTYYLNRDIGPVVLPGGYELVSVEGLVATRQTSWGDVKSLYR